MRASIAICTRDRASLLAGGLDSLTRLDVPPGLDFEVLVVDNGSSDDTGEVIARYRSALPIRAIFEPTPGLGYARNRALDEMHGDFLLFTDDDTRPEPGWLREHLLAARANPAAAFTGGPIEPEYVSPPPGWVLGNLEIFQGVLAIDPAEGRPREQVPIRSAADLPWGANLGLRPSRCGGLRFDPALGRRGSELNSGEETIFLLELLDRGQEGLWVPSAGVRHLVHPERLDPAYVVRWYRAFGRVSAGRNPDRVPGRIHLGVKWLLLRAQAGLLSPGRGRRFFRVRRRAAKARGMLDWHAARRKARRASGVGEP